MTTASAEALQLAIDPTATVPSGTSGSAWPAWPAWPSWIESYRILDCIAEGGMGRVFRALDTTSGRLVAMKLTRAGTTPEMVGLCREAAALKRLRHPGIVRLLDEGTWNGTPWLALELLTGRTLLAEMEASPSSYRGSWREPPPRRSDERPTVPGPLCPPAAPQVPTVRDVRPIVAAGRLGKVAAIVTQLANILDHLHSRGLVHRDLKPANVFLRSSDGGGAQVTLLDFGLVCRANAVRSASRADGQCVGTMQYAAPEQIRGEPVDPRTDVYSLGCILYELVTGLRPFEGDSEHEIAQKHLHRAPPAPSTLVWGLPWQLEDLLLDMLAKNPGRRPPSAGEAGGRLGRAVRGGCL